MSGRGLMIAAPASGSGKTTVTLGLLKALSERGLAISGAKAGPDYIDPRFHQAACGSPSLNLDPWAMSAARLNALARAGEGDHLLVEAMMGLFDGAADGSASAADLAGLLGLPVILVIDAARQSHSVAALARGFRDHRDDIDVVGVILNRVGGQRHRAMLADALAAIDMPVFGALARTDELTLPERHLGLVQAGEQVGLGGFVARAARLIGEHCDLEAITRQFRPMSPTDREHRPALPTLGRRIAIARDDAFSFVYPHWMADWRAGGAELAFFSPLADQAPDGRADAVFLPGGYPELHAGRLAGNETFRTGMEAARDRGAFVYGECGGYMALGDSLIDAGGRSHRMLGFLNLQTSFAQRRLHLGYRELAVEDFALGRLLRGHEFHYCSVLREDGEALFSARDATGNDLGGVGLRAGNVCGSFMHVIDPCVEGSP